MWYDRAGFLYIYKNKNGIKNLLVMEENKAVAIVKSFNSVAEAQLYKALLESAGVAARMQNDIAAQVIPAYGALMQVNLLVAVEDEGKAKEILSAGFDIAQFEEDAKHSKKEKGQ